MPAEKSKAMNGASLLLLVLFVSNVENAKFSETSFEAVMASNVTMQCELDPAIENFVGFTKNGIRIESYGKPEKYEVKFIGEYDKQFLVLVIKMLSTEDIGSYECRSSTGSDVARIQIRVHLPKPVSPQYLFTNIGSNSTVQVSATGFPMKDILWFHLVAKERRFLARWSAECKCTNESTEGFTVGEDGDLTFRRPMYRDTGLYEIVIVDGNVRHQHVVEVIFQGRAEISGDGTKVLSVVGKQATVQCKATGMPRPEMTTIMAETNLLVDHSDASFSEYESLVQSKISLDTNAQVTVVSCRAKNIYNSVEKKIFIRSDGLSMPDPELTTNTTATSVGSWQNGDTLVYVFYGVLAIAIVVTAVFCCRGSCSRYCTCCKLPSAGYKLIKTKHDDKQNSTKEKASSLSSTGSEAIKVPTQRGKSGNVKKTTTKLAHKPTGL